MPPAAPFRDPTQPHRPAVPRVAPWQQFCSSCTACLQATAMRSAKRRKVNHTPTIDSIHAHPSQACGNIQCVGCKSYPSLPRGLHGLRCTCCPGVTHGQRHAHNISNDTLPTSLQPSKLATHEVSKPANKMNELYGEFDAWSSLHLGDVAALPPPLDDTTFFADDRFVATYAQPMTESRLDQMRRPSGQHFNGDLSSTFDPHQSSDQLPPSMSCNLDVGAGHQLLHLGTGTPQGVRSTLPAYRQKFLVAADQMLWSRPDAKACSPSLDNNHALSPVSSAITVPRFTSSLPFASDLPVRQSNATPHQQTPREVNSNAEKVMNSDFASFPFDNSLIEDRSYCPDNGSRLGHSVAPRHLLNGDLLDLPSNGSSSINLFRAGTNDTTNDIMAGYGSYQNTMLSTMAHHSSPSQFQTISPHDVKNGFDYQFNDPFLPHHATDNVFFGFDPQNQQQISEYTYADPTTLQNVNHPLPEETSAVVTPDDHTSEETGRRDTSRDQELLDLRNAGLSYREIKQKYGFREAESTLRGRYRTLTKAKEERVRKPEWKSADVQLLLTTVQDHSNDSNAIPPSAFYYTEEGLPILHDESTLTKISWKKVAEAMAEQGAYHYGNATVKKKYTEVRKQKLMGNTTEGNEDLGDINALLNFGPGGYAEMYD